MVLRGQAKGEIGGELVVDENGGSERENEER